MPIQIRVATRRNGGRRQCHSPLAAVSATSRPRTSEHQAGFGSNEPDPEFSRGEPAPIGRGTIPQYAGSGGLQLSSLPNEQAFIERSQLHSARSFIGIFFAVAIIFVGRYRRGLRHPFASADLMRRMPVIGSEFVQPVPLANQVNVSDVQSSYQTVKDGPAALVLTGVVRNNSAPLGAGTDRRPPARRHPARSREFGGVCRHYLVSADDRRDDAA